MPTVEWLAEVLVGCVDRGLQLKATAGLHHAFRAGRREPPRHGFVNLLAAAAVARSRASVGEVAAVLAAEEADAGDLPGRVAGARELLDLDRDLLDRRAPRRAGRAGAAVSGRGVGDRP